MIAINDSTILQIRASQAAVGNAKGKRGADELQAASLSASTRVYRARRLVCSIRLLGLSRCRPIEKDGHKQRCDGEHAGVADDPDVAQLHVADDDSTESAKS
jgi:hypothetical protein